MSGLMMENFFFIGLSFSDLKLSHAKVIEVKEKPPDFNKF